jgi:hypothetical protein
VLIANNVCLGKSLALALREIQFRAYQPQRSEELFFLRQFLGC